MLIKLAWWLVSLSTLLMHTIIIAYIAFTQDRILIILVVKEGAGDDKLFMKWDKYAPEMNSHKVSLNKHDFVTIHFRGIFIPLHKKVYHRLPPL